MLLTIMLDKASNEENRTMAAVLLRRFLSSNFDKIYPQVSEIGIFLHLYLLGFIVDICLNTLMLLLQAFILVH